MGNQLSCLKLCMIKGPVHKKHMVQNNHPGCVQKTCVRKIRGVLFTKQITCLQNKQLRLCECFTFRGLFLYPCRCTSYRHTRKACYSHSRQPNCAESPRQTVWVRPPIFMRKDIELSAHLSGEPRDLHYAVFQKRKKCVPSPPHRFGGLGSKPN